jgi:2-dehydropantoate 2-reductase
MPSHRKVCVVGAGAIGGLMAAALARLDCDVSVIARGPHLAAIQARGLTLRIDGKEATVQVTATADAAVLGEQDVVIVAVKACGLTDALPAITPLVGANTIVVPAMNGVPWWFFSGFGGGKLEGIQLEGVDPGARIAAAIALDRVLGCVIYPSAYVAEPGVIQHTGRWDVVLGEPDGSPSARVHQLRDLFNAAGFQCAVVPDIRREIWAKLMGNASFNPLAALTGATLDYMLADSLIVELLKTLMTEVLHVGAALGLHIDETPAQRIARALPMGAIRFSMLQDMERGRPMEHESLTGAVLAIAERLKLDTPATRAVHGLIRLRAQGIAGPPMGKSVSN